MSYDKTVLKKYVFDGVDYHDLKSLRHAVAITTGQLYGDLATQEEFVQAGIDVAFVDYYLEDTLSDEDLAVLLRQRRNACLADTDFYVMPDYPADAEMLVKVKAYRQALRDLTKQAGFPRDCDFPVSPLS